MGSPKKDKRGNTGNHGDKNSNINIGTDPTARSKHHQQRNTTTKPNGYQSLSNTPQTTTPTSSIPTANDANELPTTPNNAIHEPTHTTEPGNSTTIPNVSEGGSAIFTTMNIHGLKPKTKDSKVPFINDIAVEKQMFIALTETWLQEEKDAEVGIKGYTLFRADRKREKKKRGRNSGGSAIYVKNDIANTFEATNIFSNGTVELLCIY